MRMWRIKEWAKLRWKATSHAVGVIFEVRFPIPDSRFPIPDSRFPIPMNVLLFDVARQRYALPMEGVKEIVRAVSISALPEAPSIVAGVINLRGSLVPVLDMRVRFGAEEREVRPSEHFIILEGDRPVALRVDRAVEMAQVDDAEIEKVTGVAGATPYVVGALKMPDGLVLIHDPRAFLSEAESIALSTAMSSRPDG